jgi:chromosome segregation ATPase
MTPTSRPKILLALLATGILALGALAVSVEAKPGDGQAGSQAAQDHKDAAQARKDAAQQAHAERKELREDAKEACKAADENSTLAQRCAHLKDAVKARRLAHALLTAIRVHERELGRIEVRIHEVEVKLAAGNLTGNQTHALETRLAKLNERHDKIIEKIEAEQAKLQKLHDKWAEVADHLRDRKEKGEDDGGVEDADAEDGSADGDLTTAPPA